MSNTRFNDDELDPATGEAVVVNDPTDLDNAQQVIEDELAAQTAAIEADYADDADDTDEADYADDTDEVTPNPTDTETDDGSEPEPVVVITTPEPVVITPAKRRDAAEAAWATMIEASDNGTDPDVAMVVAIATFADAPNPRNLLDTLYGTFVRDMGTDIDTSRLGRVAVLMGAIREGLPVATVATPKAAATVDPAKVRIGHLDAMGRYVAIGRALAEILANVTESVIDNPVTDLTDDERAHVLAATIPVNVAKALATLTGRLNGPTPSSAGSGAPRGNSLDTMTRDGWYTVAGNRGSGAGKHSGSVIRVESGAFGDDGRITGVYFVTTNGVESGPFVSPTAAAQSVNGGTSVNGRTFWKQVVTEG